MNSWKIYDALEIPKDRKIVFNLLGRGEYNINYVFMHPVTQRKMVLRINTASQMGLNNQIEYEYHALKLLEGTKRTPKTYYMDGSKTTLPFGILIMEYLYGRSLNYCSDLEAAAAIFADIHSAPIDEAGFLLKSKNPQREMLDECAKMASVYVLSEKGEARVRNKINELYHRAEKMVEDNLPSIRDYRIINTEVNSGNFIINADMEKCYMIDWEKPILGEVEQDLAHFIAPTTTFWKTDKLLSVDEQQYFIQAYIAKINDRIHIGDMKEKLRLYLTLTCLRGITWCAMAWVHYQDKERMIRNEDTFKKLNAYLSDDFLNVIKDNYF